jgi:predicted nucleic acid-binding protein
MINSSQPTTNVRELVIDTCVFISAITVSDPEQQECADFLQRAHGFEDRGLLLLREPPLFVLEFFAVRNRAAFDRNKFDVSLYPQFQLTATTTPLRTTIDPFTEDDAHEIMNALATRFPFQPKQGQGKPHPYCNGGDLMYLGVAKKYGCPLVTRDSGLLGYGALGFHEIVHPRDWR